MAISGVLWCPSLQSHWPPSLGTKESIAFVENCNQNYMVIQNQLVEVHIMAFHMALMLFTYLRMKALLALLHTQFSFDDLESCISHFPLFDLQELGIVASCFLTSQLSHSFACSS